MNKSHLAAMAAITGSSGFGGWATYEHYRPKTILDLLDWEGYKFVDLKDDNHLKAVYADYKKELEDSGILGNEDRSDESKSIKKLRQYCEENKNLSSSDPGSDLVFKNFSLLCAFRPKTVLGKVISEGKKITSSDEGWKTINALFKDKEEYRTLLGGEVVDHEKIKNLCEAKSSGPISQENLSVVYKWCLNPGAITVKDRLEKRYGWKKISEDEVWKTKFENKKKDQVFLDTLNAETNTNKPSPAVTHTTSKDTGYSDLKKWCDAMEVKKLYDEEVYPEIYVRVKSYCGIGN